MDLKKVGLLGGSFDPVHLAHIALANQACQSLNLDTLQLVPAADPWQRAPLKASAQHRLNMLEAAIRQHPRLSINPIEIERGGKTYTIDTLEQLPADARYYWILGSDQLQNFCTWHRWQDLIRHVELVVAARPGSSLAAPEPLSQALASLGKPITRLPFEPMPISASDIRTRLRSGQSTEGLLDPAVMQYIQAQHLYQS